MSDEVPDVSFTFGDKTIAVREYVQSLGRESSVSHDGVEITRDKQGVIMVRYQGYCGRIANPAGN